MKAFFLRYREATASLLVAAAFMLPQAAFNWQASFRGIYLSASSDETHYVSQIRDIAEGWWWLPNTYIVEGRGGSSNLYLWLLLPLGLIFRVWPQHDVASFVMFWKFAGLTASAFLLMRVLRRVRPDWPFGWTLALAAGFPVMPMLISPVFVPRLLEVMTGRGDWWEFLAWTRFANPVVSGALLLGVLLLWFSSLDGTKRRRIVLLGALSGLMAWLYIFFWLFLSVLFSVWLCVQAWRKRWRDVRVLFVALGLDAAIGFAYVWWVKMQTRASPEFVFVGPQTSHQPIIEKSVILSVIVFLGVLWYTARRERRAWRDTEWALAALALTAVLAVNQQVVTGRSLEPHHFYFITDLPLAGFLLLFSVAEIMRLWFPPRTTSLAGWAAALVLLWAGVGIQVATVRNASAAYLSDQRLAPAFEWIRRHPSPFVVLADDRVSELIPMYTGADVYYAMHANTYTTTPLARRMTAWYVRERLRGVQAEGARAAFEARRDYLGAYIFASQYYREKCGSRGCFPDAVMNQLVEGYAAFLKRDFASALRDYRVDAILWDERREPQWELERYPFIEKAEQWDGVSVWMFRSATSSMSSL